MSEWQPIATAPKDGTPVLVWGTVNNMLNANNRALAARYDRGWWLDGGNATVTHATHWMPLPKPPHAPS
jgi:hypothetical protein